MRSIDAVPPAAENLFLSIVYIESVMFKFSNSSFRDSLFSQCIVDVTSLIIPALAKIYVPVHIDPIYICFRACFLTQLRIVLVIFFLIFSPLQSIR